MAAQRPKALIVAFVWVLYPLVEPGPLGSWLGRLKFDKEAFKKALTEMRRTRELQPGLSPCFPLEELTCVKKDHVSTWFSHHLRNCDTKTRLEKCGELFSEKDCRPMADIEYELRRIQESLIHWRGA
ncbi:MAG TPA: hypothetical protein VHQ90_11990 [Thermoanaerobaculia bacterium]|nr:hypothetical protein [Thermoanaerobaculia bacterium]